MMSLTRSTSTANWRTERQLRSECTTTLATLLFVHRNVAHVVVHSDLTCLSVLQFAVDVLRVKDSIFTGHYGCGGVRAALHGERLGLIDNWLRHVQDVHATHRSFVDDVAADARLDRLCELNVIEQAMHVCETTIVQDAWARYQSVTVHA